MARIESDSKAGFYPTPESQWELVSQRLAVLPGTKVNLFDPCAGEGIALHGFAQSMAQKGVDVKTYGIEIEETRAKKAETLLNHVLYAPYEDTRVTPLSMSFMWLNPPYTMKEGERAEVVFLRDLTDGVSGKLQAGGLLGFCIPRKVLASAAAILAIRFSGIKVYKFTDPWYKQFQQVVVFGYRRRKRNTEYQKDKERLERLAYSGNIPALDEVDGITFTVPPVMNEVQTFRSNQLRQEDVIHALNSSPIWEIINQYKPKPRSVLKQPLMPLKKAHIGAAIAAGAIGGNMGTHLLVGTTKRVKSTENVYTDEGQEIIETWASKSIVRIFDRNGIHVLE